MSAIAYPPFRVYVLAGFASNSSIFMLGAGLGWYVLGVTGSAGSVGFASFLFSLPFGLFMLHAGLLTDRHGARPLVAASLFLAGVATLGLGALVLGGSAPLMAIYGLTFGVGTLLTLGGPGTISIVNDLVPPAAVSSAVAFTFLAINVGRIAGGAAAGLMLARFPAGVTILGAGILLVGSAIPVWRLPGGGGGPAAHPATAFVAPILEAARFAIQVPIVGVILLLSIGPGALGLAYNFLLPVAARELGAGADGLGLLLAAAGAGGLVAGLGAARLMSGAGHGRAIFVGLASAGAGLAAFGLAPGLQLAMAAMAFVGSGFVIYASASLSLVQALSPVELRGRLTALYSLLYWGLMPVGALLGGAVAGAASARVALSLAGAVLLVCGAAALVGRRELLSQRIPETGSPRTAVAFPPADQPPREPERRIEA